MYSLHWGGGSLLNNSKLQVYNEDQVLLDKVFLKTILDQSGDSFLPETNSPKTKAGGEIWMSAYPYPG